MTLTMDKNKSAYKLQNIPPIYYLNIDGQPERRQYVEEHFKYWEIENYTRISAYDGRDDDLGDILKETDRRRDFDYFDKIINLDIVLLNDIYNYIYL